MTALNELNLLIERLYNEAITNGELTTKPAADGVSHVQSSETDNLTGRLHRVLNEMGSHLHDEDQPNMEETAPNQEACLRILNHWEQMELSAQGLKQHMLSLEQDIEKMQPWGDFDVMKVEQLAAHGCQIRFWQIAPHIMALKTAEGWWKDSYIMVVNHSQEMVYYITVTEGENHAPQPAEASEVEICPCPVSTLIMLQTRDKDSLKKLDTLMGDYALCHYGEVYNALRSLLPEGAAMPQLATEHLSLRKKLKKLFKK